MLCSQEVFNKATKAIFIGYDDNSKVYLMMDTVTQNVIKARSMTFDENNISLLVGGTLKEKSEIVISLNFLPRSHEDTLRDNTKESTEAQATAEVTGDHDEDKGQTVEVQPASTRPRREIRVPTRYGLAYSHAAEATYPGEHDSYSEAMASPEKKTWQAAMQDELNSLKDNSTWTLVDRPKDRKVITGRWVYKIKTDEQGNIDKFKARYVAKSFMQVPGLDFHETYAPTCKPEHVRTSCSVGPRASSDGRQNGLLKLTFDRNCLLGTIRRVHRGQRQSVFTSMHCLWFEASWTRLVTNAEFFSRGNRVHYKQE